MAAARPAVFACASLAPLAWAAIAARAAASISFGSPLITTSAKYRCQSPTMQHIVVPAAASGHE
ncbi:hypothetical protein CIK06_13220 [Plantactinospora sp. KBS50]|nr:hypothetical protein CIK06_13220 [Plantactinospora sp. KBS50]